MHHQRVEINRTRIHMERSKRYAVIGLATGILCGFLLCLWTKPLILCTGSNCCLKQQLRAEIQHEMDSKQQPTPKEVFQTKKVLIGVMTAAKFLDNRALAVWKTWAKDIDGDVVFFSSENSSANSDIPLVALPGVTDAYPPQKKSFMMIKYLYDFGAGKYDFFMRVDDDIYIHGERLHKFLTTLNHSETLYIGQAGTGNAEELGRLSLSLDENFCMGGPGILLSEETLSKVVPHISYCLQNLLTSHEDVELGRCIRMFAGVPCTWTYEMQKLFYHSYTYKTDRYVFPYVMTGPEMDQAITLHPIKRPDMMYQLHNEMTIRRKAELEVTRMALAEELNSLEQLIEHSQDSTNSMLDTSTNAVPWTFMNARSEYAHNMFSVRRNHEGAWKQLLNKAMNYVLFYYNSKAQLTGGMLDHPELIHGYRRIQPIRGVQLKLNLRMVYQPLRRKHLKTLVTKQVFLEIPLGESDIREVTIKKDMIHLIMPLSGKLNELRRFLKQFERVCGGGDLCDLMIVLYRTADYEETVQTINESTYHHLIKVIPELNEFSRAVALHQGIMQMDSTDLVCFIDVDIHFHISGLTQLRQHTVLNAQAYFPIVFNQYDSQMVCKSDSCPVGDHSSDTGAFRFFGYGIVSLYKMDYIRCGGFDLSIHGWGKEDVDLYTKVLRSGLTVYRAPNPGITHVYHPKICESSLNADQTVMCLNSKATSFASKKTLAHLYFNVSGQSIS